LQNLSWPTTEMIYYETRKILYKDSNWVASPERQNKQFKRYANILSPSSIINKKIMDFGCGNVNPLAISSLFFLNGASDVFAIDIVRNKDDSIIASRLLELLLDVSINPSRYTYFNNSKIKILSNLELFNFDELLNGNWRAGIKHTTIKYLVIDSKMYTKYIDYLDTIVSYTVLEHVMPFRENMKRLTELLQSNGMMYHRVDFSDHDRKIDKSKTAAWKFLCSNDVRCAKSCNRIRYSEMIDIMNTLGLTLVKSNKREANIPEDLRKKLLPQFAHIKEDDLKIISADLLFQKTGSTTELEKNL